LMQEIASHAEHLHHVELVKARQQFKPISHAVVKLAAQLRGDDAQSPFIHFYCPMVKGGGGDWLQASGELANPYYGSEMLRCGEKVRVLPPRATTAESTQPHRE